MSMNTKASIAKEDETFNEHQIKIQELLEDNFKMFGIIEYFLKRGEQAKCIKFNEKLYENLINIAILANLNVEGNQVKYHPPDDSPLEAKESVNIPPPMHIEHHPQSESWRPPQVESLLQLKSMPQLESRTMLESQLVALPQLQPKMQPQLAPLSRPEIIPSVMPQAQAQQEYQRMQFTNQHPVHRNTISQSTLPYSNQPRTYQSNPPQNYNKPAPAHQSSNYAPSNVDLDNRTPQMARHNYNMPHNGQIYHASVGVPIHPNILSNLPLHPNYLSQQSYPVTSHLPSNKKTTKGGRPRLRGKPTNIRQTSQPPPFPTFAPRTLSTTASLSTKQEPYYAKNNQSYVGDPHLRAMNSVYANVRNSGNFSVQPGYAMQSQSSTYTREHPYARPDLDNPQDQHNYKYDRNREPALN